MARLVWGKARQLRFYDQHEYYQALGSLCRRNSYTITFETNSETDSWGDAFRIKCLESDRKTPDAFIHAMRNARRINCNDYVQSLYENHNFDFDIANKVLHGDYAKVIETVPQLYHEDFKQGFNLEFTRHKKEDYVSTYTVEPSSKWVAAEKTVSNNVKSKEATTPPPVTKPKIEPIPITLGEKVKHKTLGVGVIKSINGDYLIIAFPGKEDKKFSNPQSFSSGFLSKIE